MQSHDRKALRRAIRAKRRAVSPAQREAASRRIAKHVSSAFHLYPGKRIALYSSMRDEVDTLPLVNLARRYDCEIFLPRIIDRHRHRMRFFELSESMRPNHLGILEPDSSRSIDARWLHLVFVPLVGFDATGMRLGMGAGYYDRAFEFRRWRQDWRGPHLIGIAYGFQQVDHIEAAPHDVRLDAMVTEQGVLQCRIG
jgi:5-formyltetrahydrofolate cyclo-ligase